MKRQILNLGKALNKAEQKSISGGADPFCRQFDGEPCNSGSDCRPVGYSCRRPGVCQGHVCVG